MDEITGSLGTHINAQLRFGIGRRFDDYHVVLSQLHFSNGKSSLGWNDPNSGENFLVLQVVREL